MTERLMTYDEMEIVLRRSPEAVRQLVKRRRWRRVVGNDRKARIAVPVDFIEANVPDDTDTTPSHPSPTTPIRHPAEVEAATPQPPEATGDARALLDMLQARIAELDSEVKELRPKAARVDVVEALLDAERKRVEEIRETERQRAEEWKQVADRFAAQAEQMLAAQARRSWWPWRRSA